MSDGAVGLPPRSLEAEEALLGSILIDQSVLPQIRKKLKPHHFYGGIHSINSSIYQTMCWMEDEGIVVDLVTIDEYLGKFSDGIEYTYIVGLLNTVPTAMNAEQYAEIILEKALKRFVIKNAEELATMAFDDRSNIRDIVKKSNLLSQEVTGQIFVERKHEIDVISSEILDRLLSGESPPRILTGLSDVDAQVGGIMQPQYVIVAGRPGMGKTSLMLRYSINMAKKGTKVAIYSREMDEAELVYRMVSMQSGITFQRIRNNDRLSDADTKLIMEAIGEISMLPISFIDKGDGTIESLRSSAMDMRNRDRMDILMVDYIQMLSAEVKTDNQNLLVTRISRGLKNIALDNEIPVIALSQLRRIEDRADKHPTLADLRDSGSLEQDADIIMLLYREGYYKEESERPNITELDIAKNRNGPTGVVDLLWVDYRTDFRTIGRNDFSTFNRRSGNLDSIEI